MSSLKISKKLHSLEYSDAKSKQTIGSTETNISIKWSCVQHKWLEA